jgi:transcriptional regulator with XRE-family HTH domain
MDSPDKNKKTSGKTEEVYTQEQLSLDLELPENEPQTGSSAAKTEPAAKKTEPTAQNKENGSEPDSELKREKKAAKEKSATKKGPSQSDFKEVYLDIGVASLGKYLQDMRVKNNYSIEQVEEITRIKRQYIELLEMEKIQIQLPSVYILAYARKLCACYNVPESETDAIINELKMKLDRSFPHDFINNINIDYEIDEDSQKKLRHFAWLLLGALGLFIVLVGIAVFILSAPRKPAPVDTSVPLNAPEKFDQEKLRVLQPPVIIEATELPAKPTD